MESTSFKNILDKFKDGANSMGEVYSELTYLTTNYDKEIEKLQNELENEKTRANNEEFVRHEAERDLLDYKKLQEINFSVIIEELIKKPRQEFEYQLRSSLRKFTTILILLTAVCIGLIIASSSYFQKNNIQVTETKIDLTKMNKVIDEIKKENSELKKFIRESLKKPVLEKKEQALIITDNPKDVVVKKEIIEEEKQKPELDTKAILLDKVLGTLVSYDNKFKLSGKNNSRLLYKMFLLDLAPFKHELVLQEIKLFAKEYTYVPTKDEIVIWDKQMLLIYTKMLEKIQDIPESKITSLHRAFHNYKENDATVYSGWEYVGESGISMKKSLEKEISKLKTQIELNQ